MNEPYAYWSSLKHGGMLMSQSRLENAFPPGVDRLPDWKAQKLRRLVQLDAAAGDGAVLLDFVLTELCGFSQSEISAGDRIGSDWTRRLTTGELVKPRRLWSGDNAAALPVFVEKEKRLGVGRGRRSIAKIVEWMRIADRKLALVTNFQQWRLVYAGLDFESWAEWDTEYWFEEGDPSAQVDAIRILLCRDALSSAGPNESSRLIAAILDSRKGEAELSASLGERVRRAVEILIQAYAEPLQALEGSVGNADIYRAATRMVMRLVVVLFAEARELLPLDNPVYLDSYSVKSLVHELGRFTYADGLANRRAAWPRILALFQLIYRGSPHEMLPVLRYGGGLFKTGDPQSSDPILRAVSLFEGVHGCPTDLVVRQLLEYVCQAKVKIRSGRGAQTITAPIDFSDLSSEYIGILYEGLLDFELRRADSAMLFLNLGDQPALPLDRLAAMDNVALADLVTRFKVKAEKIKAGDEEADDGDDDVDAPEDSSDEDVECDAALAAAADDDSFINASNADDRMAVANKAQTWAARAVAAGKLVPKPRGRNPEALERYQRDVEAKAASLIGRIVLPGEWFLVRWGGTRKGSGTFYTRPALAVPTAIRTLLPLANNPPVRDDGRTDTYARPAEWIPKGPGEILALKVCDPSMGSASFLVAALRYLTDCLFNSLFQYGWLVESGDGIGLGAPPNPMPAWLDECIKDLPLGGSDGIIKARLKRLVVERCLYGVDLDALAVELGRLALWVETMDKDLPFEFLDHKMKCGNALIGCWFDRFRDYPLLAWKRDGGDKGHKGVHVQGGEWTKAISGKRDGDVRRQMIELITGQLTLDVDLPAGKSAESVHDDAERTYDRLTQSQLNDPFAREKYYDDLVADDALLRLKQLFDTWCALWFWSAAQVDIAPLPLALHRLTDEQSNALEKIVSEYKFFHWELEFPDVFTKSRSGFDAVIGNPPWETMKPNSKEFFSNIDPLYRAYGKQQAIGRQREIFEDSAADELSWLGYCSWFSAFSHYVKNVMSPFGDGEFDGEAFSLGRGSTDAHVGWLRQRAGRGGYADRLHPYRYQGGGDINTYKMFLEVGLALIRPGGQMGLIVLSGVYTDRGTTTLRNVFLSRCEWTWLFGFENRDKVFDIDSRFKFCPIVVRKGGSTQQIRAAFMRRDVSDWAEAESYALDYPAENVRKFSPYSSSILEINSRRDLDVLEKIYANSVLLGDEGPGGWGVKYSREFDMTNDSKLFPPREDWEAKGYKPDEYGRWIGPEGDVALPLYQGVMLWQMSAVAATYVSGVGGAGYWSGTPLDFVDLPNGRYYMAEPNTASRASWTNYRIGFRSVQNASNQRTLIAAILPPCPSGNSIAQMASSRPIRDLILLCALTSFPFDYALRPKMSQNNVNWFYLEECPVPQGLWTSIVGSNLQLLSARLCLGPKMFAPLRLRLRASQGQDGRALASDCAAVTASERLRMRCMLDSILAHIYGLSRDDFAHILRHCDYPNYQTTDNKFTRSMPAKGFWRVDKERDPELRHTVLSLIAFHDLQRMIDDNGGDREAGIEAFCAQNDGEGWMLPDYVTLSDYGLGHDERAKHPQPVASRLGPRFLPWQLEQTPEESWAECERHARNILGEAGYQQLMDEIEAERVAREADEVNGASPKPEVDYSKLPADTGTEAIAGETDLFGIPVDKNLFGEAVDTTSRKKRR